MGRGVVEISRAGKVVWKCAESRNPMCAQRLDNGNTLVVSKSGQRVCEVDPKNKVVRVFEMANQALSAIRLPGGDTLVGGNRYLHRCDAKGKKVGQFDVNSAMQVKYY